MPTVYGVDGSRSGWIAVGRDTASGAVSWQRVTRLADLLEGPPRPEVVAISIPIGLPDEGARACDVETRKRVGARRNSVFSAPLRPMLAAARKGESPDRRAATDGKGVSPHIWSIVTRIIEVDELLRHDASRQNVLREMHPELSFTVMNEGTPMQYSRKSAEGREERRLLLRLHYGDQVDRALAEWRRLRCAPDDILDAFAALWTAGRIHAGKHVVVPSEPVTDSFGLRMEIAA